MLREGRQVYKVGYRAGDKFNNGNGMAGAMGVQNLTQVLGGFGEPCQASQIRTFLSGVLRDLKSFPGELGDNSQADRIAYEKDMKVNTYGKYLKL